MTGRKQQVRIIAKLQRSADRGDLQSLHDLAARYATGEDGLKKDLRKAVGLYLRAAEKGDPPSQYDLGFMFLLGEGIPKDISGGLKWMELAAESGYRDAARFLCEIHTNGYHGVKKDPARSEYWSTRLSKIGPSGVG